MSDDDDDDDDDDDEAEGDDDEGDSADAWSVVRRHQPLKKYCCRGTRLGSKGCRRENQREPRRAVSSRPVTAAGAAPRSVPAGRRVNARPAAPLLMVAKCSVMIGGHQASSRRLLGRPGTEIWQRWEQMAPPSHAKISRCARHGTCASR